MKEPDTYGFAIRATALVAFIVGLVAGLILGAVS
jgi:hypothetical protein